MTAADNFIRIGKLRLHYLEFGNVRAPVIVCLHGLTNNAHDFDLIAEHLAPRYRVIALDIRGRGESEWGPAPDYNIPTYSGDLAALLDALKVERVSLIGNSMGGRLSILYAARNPARVDRIVLNDIGPSLDPAITAQINAHVAQTPVEFDTIEAVVSYYRNDPSMAGLAGFSGAGLIEAARWSVKITPAGRLTWKLDPALRASSPGQSAIRQLDLWPQYRNLTVPVFIVRGGESNVLPKTAAQEMCGTANHARLVEVPGVGHLPSLVEPEALAALRLFFDL